MRAHAKRLFIPATLFNWLVVLSILFLSDWLRPLLPLDVSIGTNLAFRDIGLALIAVFGLSYGLVAFQPQRFRPYIGLGIVAKSLVVMTVYGHWFAGHIDWQLPVVAFGDVVFVALFYNFLRRYPV